MTSITKSITAVKKFSIDELMETIRKGIDNSILDMIVTVFITAATVFYMFNNVNPAYLDHIPGMYIFGMMIQLMIRIVQRFDSDYTVNELANQVTGLEDRLTAKLDQIINNQ